MLSLLEIILKPVIYKGTMLPVFSHLTSKICLEVPKYWLWFLSSQLHFCHGNHCCHLLAVVHLKDDAISGTVLWVSP